jgi:hypothetical protein
MHSSSPKNMSRCNKVVLTLSYAIITIECVLLAHYHTHVIDWLRHHLWVVVLPFTKTIIKHIIALQLTTFFKALSLFLWHCMKLVLIKLFKTIGLRYGLFFSQYRWRIIRQCKLIFLRKGKLFFRQLLQFWRQYSKYQQWIILLAFFPVAITLFLLGLSFNITRRTMVQKTQEAAMVKVATSASQQSKGMIAQIERLDRRIIHKIRSLRSPPSR